MEQIYQDIPRLYTALAEWCACVMYGLILKRLNMEKRFVLCSAAALVWQCAFMVFTDNLPLSLWIPCMIVAVGSMYLFLYVSCRIPRMTAGYCCARAFLLAEFAASLEWQLDCYLRGLRFDHMAVRIGLLFVVYGLVFAGGWFMERTVIKGEFRFEISGRELWSAVLIVIAAFAFSNLSFIYQDTPFSSRFAADIFNIRTLVDLGGIAILYAFQSRIYELNAERELSSINTMLKSQYDRYRQYQESIDLIHMKYHDLKHQIAGLRAELDTEKRSQWLDAMEEELKMNQIDVQTGNHVLDTVLTGKMMYCKAHDIGLTCVADGELLNFIHVTDICTIFGNALDNAMESLMMVEDAQKRLVHLSVSRKKNFVFIQIENYCEQELTITHGYPVTTKTDKQNHGIGLKSIRYSVEKYGGTVSFDVKHNWFELKIMIPVQES